MIKRLIYTIILFIPISTRAQTLALKSNILCDLTSSINIGVEKDIHNGKSLNLSLTYNPWTFEDNRKTKFLLVQPEYRIWDNDTFNGFFYGLQGNIGMFNCGGMLPFGFKSGTILGYSKDWIQNNRYQGYIYGMSLGCGYQYMISTSLNMELSCALGFITAKYAKYGQNYGADKIDNDSYNYLGPTRISLSLTYFIK